MNFLHSFFINSSNISIMNVRCLFKQNVDNVSAHQLQQYTIQICCKMINEFVKQIILYRRQNYILARYMTLASLDSVPAYDQHMIIHWHIHMVHLLFLLH